MSSSRYHVLCLAEPSQLLTFLLEAPDGGGVHWSIEKRRWVGLHRKLDRGVGTTSKKSLKPDA